MEQIKKVKPELRFPEFVNDGEWEEKELGEISEIVRGGSPRPIQDYLTTSSEGLNWLKIADVHSDSKYITATKEKVINEALSSTREVDCGDLILSNSMSFGRPYILKIKTCIHDGWIAIRKISNVTFEDYLYYFISSAACQNYFNTNAAGAAVKNLNAEIIKLLPISLPKNIKEQQKIADCLSSLDELITAHQDKLEGLKNHKKGLLQNLFPQEGQKVPHYRFPEFVNDGEWESDSLGNVTNYFKGFAFQSKDYSKSGRRIVRVSDMGYDYIKDKVGAIFICESLAIQYKKWELKENDIIITTVGSKPPVYDSLVGRTIIVNSKDDKSLLNQNAVCLRANVNIEQSFLNLLFKKKEYVTFIESIIRGNANQGSITLEDLFKYSFLKPCNPKEQQKIADCLTTVDNLITSQTEKIEQLKIHKKGLMQGLFPKTTY